MLQNVDRIIDMQTVHKMSHVIYLHAPIWFVKYEYNHKTFNLIVDGVVCTVLKSAIPVHNF